MEEAANVKMLNWPLTVDLYHPLDIYQWSQPRIIVEKKRDGEMRRRNEESQEAKVKKIKGDLVLPQEVRRQRIHMTGVEEKEDPYRKCIDRERSSERPEEERGRVGEPLQRGRSGKGK